MAKQPIPSKLLARVKEQDKARFKADYQEANFVLDVLRLALEEEIKVLSDREDDDSIFEDPGFASKYAHIMGQRRMAKKLLNLFPKKG